ncbi:hypothetical protein [Streptomyces harbinensis]|uniref:hypothetical protein n=1 Tax=Streptomyces harbinensis TaxID=1176198 RepID=UPI0036863F95
MTETFAAQGGVIRAVAAMSRAFGHLPPIYISLSRHDGAGILAVDAPDAFEVWREALGIPPQAVELRSFAGSSWVVATVTWHGAAFELSCHAIPAVAPHEAENGGAL